MPPFGAWERVKGKRVQIPHDLVTVIREPAARVHLHRSLGFDPGRRRQALSFQPGNLPAVGTGALLQITRNWLYLKSSWKIRGSFCVAVLHTERPSFFVAVLSAKLLRLGFVSCTCFSANGFAIGERKQNT